jgi:hypothetical protein
MLLEQSTEAQRGSRCIVLLFLQPRRYMGVGGQRQAPVALAPGKTQYTLYRGLDGPVWTCAENLAHTGILSPDRPARSESLYRLCYPGRPNGNTRIFHIVKNVTM